MRKLLGTLLAVAIAAAGVVGLMAFFNSRDDSTTGGDRARPATGTPRSPAGAEELLTRGNVVLRYSDARFTPRLRALAADLGAPDSPELRAAGQAVVLRRDPQTGGVAAEALEHRLTVRAPDDPQLQAFIEQWLGQGAAG